MFPKVPRVVDEDLRAAVSRQPCAVCGVNPRSGNDTDHVTSKGAGGGDTVDNLMPLCRRHHTERHLWGPWQMSERYTGYRQWMILHQRQDVLDRTRLRRTGRLSES